MGNLGVFNQGERVATTKEEFVMNLEEQATVHLTMDGKPYAMKVARTVWGGVTMDKDIVFYHHD